MFQSVPNENWDQFLETVLNEVTFHEVDLSFTNQNAEYFDQVIAADEKLIVPGLGEGGVEAHVPKAYELLVNETMKNESFNRILGQLISLTRSVPDPRETTCRDIEYNLEQLPSLSIIIIFKNEVYTSMIRLLHSIFMRTPTILLKEVILVDDFSSGSHEDLFGKLERYMATKLPVDKIRLVRLHNHAGLIRARMIGAHLAVGQVLVFLDAHCEVTYAWYAQVNF